VHLQGGCLGAKRVGRNLRLPVVAFYRIIPSYHAWLAKARNWMGEGRCSTLSMGSSAISRSALFPANVASDFRYWIALARSLDNGIGARSDRFAVVWSGRLSSIPSKIEHQKAMCSDMRL